MGFFKLSKGDLMTWMYLVSFLLNMGKHALEHSPIFTFLTQALNESLVFCKAS